MVNPCSFIHSTASRPLHLVWRSMSQSRPPPTFSSWSKHLPSRISTDSEPLAPKRSSFLDERRLFSSPSSRRATPSACCANAAASAIGGRLHLPGQDRGLLAFLAVDLGQLGGADLPQLEREGRAHRRLVLGDQA